MPVSGHVAPTRVHLGCHVDLGGLVPIFPVVAVPLTTAGEGVREMLGFFDPVYLLFMIPGLLIAGWATLRVKSNFRKYSAVGIASGLSGAEVARRILDHSGIRDVRIEPASGMLSDHYDTRSRTLRLSNDVFHGRSVAAAGIAAHEAGHALQHAKEYGPLALRQGIAPTAAVGSNVSWILLILGAVFNSGGLMWAGIILFSVAVVFTLVTLPVEFNASARAKRLLPELGLVAGPPERRGIDAVLNAAAMTYVAAAVTAVMTLLYYLLRLGLLGGSDD